jgi:flagellar protein FliS
MNYQQQSVAGMNGVELIVALYDGMARFLHRAIQAIEANDVPARRAAIKRTLDILIHLQSRLRMDIGGSSAKALAEFYAAIFALCINGSRTASAEQLRHAIRLLQQRDASAPRMPLRAAVPALQEPVVSSWSA